MNIVYTLCYSTEKKTYNHMIISSLLLNSLICDNRGLLLSVHLHPAVTVSMWWETARTNLANQEDFEGGKDFWGENDEYND